MNCPLKLSYGNKFDKLWHPRDLCVWLCSGVTIFQLLYLHYKDFIMSFDIQKERFWLGFCCSYKLALGGKIKIIGFGYYYLTTSPEEI